MRSVTKAGSAWLAGRRGRWMSACKAVRVSICSSRLRAYEFAGVSYVMPFFFSFMFLMNQGSAVWGESLLLALILLFQFDTLWALASSCGTCRRPRAVHAGRRRHAAGRLPICSSRRRSTCSPSWR
jgi:hypothetical protein